MKWGCINDAFRARTLSREREGADDGEVCKWFPTADDLWNSILNHVTIDINFFIFFLLTFPFFFSSFSFLCVVIYFQYSLCSFCIISGSPHSVAQQKWWACIGSIARLRPYVGSWKCYAHNFTVQKKARHMRWEIWCSHHCKFPSFFYSIIFFSLSFTFLLCRCNYCFVIARKEWKSVYR